MNVVFTKEEWLNLITSTDGMECPKVAFDDNLLQLERDKIITISSGHGPDGKWHRLELVAKDS